MTERRKLPGVITDEELKEIKESQIDPRIAECYLNTWINTRHLKAIVERLEAAERVCNGIIKYTNIQREIVPIAEDIKAWRKSKGE